MYITESMLEFHSDVTWPTLRFQGSGSYDIKHYEQQTNETTFSAK